ncbi:MAG: hypothetical protein KatS3mg031_2231 [Chitinophagales bacterium]|nr:MAG: hypothetical protein KatS3mg031_2231 [Chitinophagales bacterium]
MEYKDIVAIRGLGGLFEVIAKREDGMIVRGLEERKPRFVSSRNHVFSPLETITIYTTKDTVELLQVLLEMKKQLNDNPPVSANAGPEELRSYFKKILPDYDEERVYASDIKKVIRWFQLLHKYDLVKEPAPPAKEKEEKEKPAEEKKPVKAGKTKQTQKEAKAPRKETKEKPKEKPVKASTRKAEAKKPMGPRKAG